MPSRLLLDLDVLDLNAVAYDAEAIEAVNPHRGAMRQLDGVAWAEPGPPIRIVGYKDVRDDEFWVPGHIPGRPILPGVLMIEAAAQLAAFAIAKFKQEPGFLGFLGCNDVKFRGQVTPGQRLWLLGQEVKYRPGRRFVCEGQGVVDGKLVFEASIEGMAI